MKAGRQGTAVECIKKEKIRRKSGIKPKFVTLGLKLNSLKKIFTRIWIWTLYLFNNIYHKKYRNIVERLINTQEYFNIVLKTKIETKTNRV